MHAASRMHLMLMGWIHGHRLWMLQKPAELAVSTNLGQQRHQQWK